MKAGWRDWVIVIVIVLIGIAAFVWANLPY